MISGEIAMHSGNGKTDYGFTGEMQAGGLVHLRARDYATADGRFLTKDSWDGDANLPVSYNKWLYANGNPVRYVDPSGMISEGEEDEEANKLIELLKTTYSVEVIRDWGIVSLYDPYTKKTDCIWQNGNWNDLHELELVRDSVNIMSTKMGAYRFKKALGGTKIKKLSDIGSIIGLRSSAPPFVDTVFLTDNALFDTKNDQWIKYIVIHEFAHIWDFRSGEALSLGMAQQIGTYSCKVVDRNYSCKWDIDDGTELPPGTVEHNYASTNKWEDWAEAFANTIYPSYYPSVNIRSIGPKREMYVLAQISGIR